MDATSLAFRKNLDAWQTLKLLQSNEKQELRIGIILVHGRHEYLFCVTDPQYSLSMFCVNEVQCILCVHDCLMSSV